ncbi:uncharacterized protein [Rutidosis leptorrhynchoides]|uniref:uncharacterized protein n=1 Tax=Rutidosis leptorrhynchoides TaxID=125765 RepID=UPI003A9A2CC9
MFRHFKKLGESRNFVCDSVTTNLDEEQDHVEETPLEEDEHEHQTPLKKYTKVGLNELVTDPGERLNMELYHSSQRDEIKRKYLLKGPCQPQNHSIRQRKIGVQGGADNFVKGGFQAWNKKERVDVHDASMPHTIAVEKCQNSYCDKVYRYVRSHIENEDSVNKGNFLELLHWLARHTENIGHVVLKNAPKNSQMTCSSIQKDIVHAAATEVEKAIAKETGDEFFFVLVDKSRDVSCKEQMSLVLCFVNNEGVVVERFVGIKQVNDTSALSL